MNRRALLIVGASALIIGSLFLLAVVQKYSLKIAAKQKQSQGLADLVAQEKLQEAKGDLLGAKQTLQKLVNDYAFDANEAIGWQKGIEGFNIKLLFSPIITPKSVLYEIVPGDTLTKIAHEFKTTIELIMKSNNLVDDKITPGKKIKIWNAPFAIFVDKSQNILMLKCGEEIIKTYTVSTGKNNCTPVGTFKITNKLVNPTWFKAGAVVPAGSPENILGTRWLGFDMAGYGIHGTIEPHNLGAQVTQGCIRMANLEVEELYTIVPVGTEVTIVD